MQENVCHPVICVCDDDVENDPVVLKLNSVLFRSKFEYLCFMCVQ